MPCTARTCTIKGTDGCEEEIAGRILRIDWAEDHHDIALADRGGKLLARLRISDDAAGLARLLELIAAHGDSAEAPSR